MSATRTIYQAIEEAILEYTDGTGRIYSEQEEGLWNIADRTAAALTPAPDLAQTIAGMTEQWRHEVWHDRGDGIGPWRSLCWPHDDGWRNTRESADFDLAQADGTFKHRLVRRLVGPVEVAE